MTQNNCHFRSRPCRTALRNLLLLTVAVSCFHPLITRAQGGVPLWTNINNINATAVAVDSNGNVFVTGYPAMVAYSGAGTPLWTNFNQGTSLVVDSRGNVIVTGGGVTIKFSSSLPPPAP